MPTEVLYRKWRPQRFADVAGQDVVTRTLLNALASRKVSHAYLFSGPRGTGKTTMARLLAKAINCQQNAGDGAIAGEPCNECASCREFGTGSSLDLVEKDGASNRGIDDIRELRDNANYMPMGGETAHKVYLIDEVHMLTEPAFNALLKTLEEPPPHVVFILATTDAHKVPATILSRCQRHEFRRIPLSAMSARLAHIASQEGIEIPGEALELIARSATGSLRDAINLLEQICDSYGKQATLEAVRQGLGLIADERATRLALQAVRGDLAGGLASIGSVRDDGLDLRQFQREVVMRLRELLHVQSGAASEGLWTSEQLTGMRESIAGVSQEKLVQALRAFGLADLRADPLSPLPLELALAETVAPPQRSQAAPGPAQRPAPAATAQRPPLRGQYEGRNAPAPPPPRARPAPVQTTPPARAQAVPADLRKDLSKASAEDIAQMLGSTAAVIPPASDAGGETGERANGASAVPAGAGSGASSPSGAGDSASSGGAGTAESGNGTSAAGAGSADASGGAGNAGAALSGAGSAGVSGGVDLAGFVGRLRHLARPRSVKLDALLNGSCEAVSWQDGVLTLGFFNDGFHKKGVDDPANRRVYEELAAEIIGATVSIRCIIAPRPARPISKSPLVQHAVGRGATIISEEQEP